MNTFSSLIRKEEELLERLLYVSQRQLEIVRDGNMTTLLEHLGQRQQLWNEFEVLEEQLKPHKEIPSEERIWSNTGERQSTEDSWNRCKTLLEEIMTTDNVSLTETSVQKTETESQIKRVQKVRNVVPAYAKHSNLPQNR
jgi:ABC-type uncharacterized transport system ATPase subunit